MQITQLNIGNSVRFLAKIPNGTAAESPCYSVFWNAIDFCRLNRFTSTKKNLNVGHANRPAFCRQVPLLYAKCPSKKILQIGRSANEGVNNVRTVTCQAYTQTRAFGLRRGHFRSRHIRSKIGRFDTCRPNVNAKSTRAFP